MPFGTTVNTTGAEAFMYTGKPVDDITGLYYFGARFYDPSIFRFITQDSYVGYIEDPISLNQYIYARDNPLAFKDPDGNNPISAWDSLSARNQAILITAFTCVIAFGAILATVSCPALMPLARSAIGAAISATMYTVFSGEEATSTGATLAAASGAVTGFTSGCFSMVSKAVPTLTTTMKLATGLVAADVNMASQVAQDIVKGEGVSIDPLPVATAFVAYAIPVPQSITLSEEVYNYVLPPVTSNLITNNAEEISVITNIAIDAFSTPVKVSPYEPDWSTFNLIF